MRYGRVVKEDLSTSVARQLRSAILTGAHQPGELLAPERELAAQFGVDRHTLRTALSELEQLGLVQRRQGSGCRVLDFRETGTLDLIKFLVVKPGTDEIDLTMVAPVMEVGRVTLQGLMDLVVERADRDDLAAMQAQLEALANTVSDGSDAASIIGSERRFFRLVFRGAHSVVAELLANTFDQIFDAALDPEGRVRLHWDDVLVSSGRLDAYRRVVEAIEHRDPAEARHLVGVIVGTIPAAVATAAAQPTGRRPSRRRHADTG
jgi:GntR family transcriptional regulator, transcriptional repressor for pyruvate dehydrogenase complex